MADLTVEAAMLAGTSRGMRSVVFVNRDIGYVFGINGDSDLDYMKTTDGGLTWGVATNIFTGTIFAFDVWYDQWTPGDTGRIIHLWFISLDTDDVFYQAFNTATDVLGSQIVIFAGATLSGFRGTFCSGAKMRGGNLLMCFNGDAFAETATYKSINNGATWSVLTNVIEADNDQCKIFPANVADPNDGWLLYQDA